MSRNNPGASKPARSKGKFTTAQSSHETNSPGEPTMLTVTIHYYILYCQIIQLHLYPVIRPIKTSNTEIMKSEKTVVFYLDRINATYIGVRDETLEKICNRSPSTYKDSHPSKTHREKKLKNLNDRICCNNLRFDAIIESSVCFIFSTHFEIIQVLQSLLFLQTINTSNS